MWYAVRKFKSTSYRKDLPTFDVMLSRKQGLISRRGLLNVKSYKYYFGNGFVLGNEFNYSTQSYERCLNFKYFN
jgi:hypothetical protein